MRTQLTAAFFFQAMITWFNILVFRVSVFFVLALMLSALITKVADAQTTKTVRPGEDSSYFLPSVEVEYDDPVFGSVSKQLVHGECSFMDRYVTRVCARITLPKAEFFPGDKGYDADNPEVNKAADNYGNRTGIEGNPRIQICAYEDPCDGNDPPGGKCFSNLTSPYHHKTSAKTVMSMTQTTVFSAMVSAWVGGLGVMLAPGIHAILATYNHIVTKNLGCVDVPLAPLPPEWCHSCWEVAYSPNPEVKINTSATFFDPKTNVRICVNKDDESHLEDCRSPDAKTLEEFVLTPDHTTKIMKNDLPVFEACKVETKAKAGRQFCARISTMRPKHVCVYKKSGNSKDILISCIDRPEWMPKPTLGEITNMYMGPKMSVTYPDNGNIELQEDPFLFDGDPGTTANLGWNKHCSYLEQQKFCLYRPCQTFTKTGECEQIEEDTMCVSGYESPYGVIINTADGSVIAGLPNKQEPTLNNAWVYKPPFCWQRDKISGRCLNYDDRPNGGVCCDIINDPNGINKIDLCPGIKGPYKNTEGKCIEYVRNVAPEDSTQQPDIYMINDDPINPLCDTDINKVADKEKECRPTHTLRPLSDKEAGMCQVVPPNPDRVIKNGRATGVYVVGKNCGRVAIRMWGGGGAGYARAGYTFPDQAGGSGAYAQLELQVTEGNKINYIAGRGSQRLTNSNLHAGEASSIFHTYNGVEEKISVGAGSLGGKGTNSIDTWKWNGVLCDTKDPNASCYIHPKTRDGFNGGQNTHGMRGPGGGNAPDFCFKGANISNEVPKVNCGLGNCDIGTKTRSISHYKGPRPGLCSSSGDLILPAGVTAAINLANKEAATNYVGCMYHGVRAPLSSEETPLPEEPDISVDPLDWPFKWPGAGGCSYDDPSNEPWGEGSHGRIEISCIAGIGAAGNQKPCPATANVYTKRFDPIKEAFNHEVCQLPETQHGFNAPNDACTAVAPNNPLQIWIERNFSGSPRCDSGRWTY